eukprot:13900564-Ditylum_brightwellii.AAC.1
MVQMEVDQTYKCEAFLIKDRVDRGEVEMEHCGAKEMVADYFTKPLQHYLFQNIWKAILNLEDK